MSRSIFFGHFTPDGIRRILMVPRHRDGLVTKDKGFTESFTRLKAFAPAKILAFWSTFVVSRSCRSQFSKSSLGRWTDCWVFCLGIRNRRRAVQIIEQEYSMPTSAHTHTSYIYI